MLIYKSIVDRKSKIGIIGLGYVGLPIALAFARNASVIGFDINQQRIEVLQKGIDPSKEMESAAFEGCDVTFTSCIDELREAKFFIVAVPTPVDTHNVPDLGPLKRTSETVGKVLKSGDYVVFESTVYPGCTEEDCLPILERVSGLTVGKDFKLGYSPERINPGDKKHTLQTVIKVVSGSDETALDEIAKVYGLVANAGIHKVSSLKVAEATKVIENIQRDLNIALMNELSIIFDKMNINTYEVLEAAGTKWNFMKFSPGLVGGHCIGVDPYYLTYKASELGFNSRVILSGRYINDNMGNYVAKKVLQHVIAHSANVKEAKILILGATFKENVSDIRNSKIAEVVKTLQSYHLQIFVSDPYAESEMTKQEYNFELTDQLENDYDVVIISVGHAPYLQYDDAFFSALTKEHALIIDLKGIYRNKITSRKYWSL